MSLGESNLRPTAMLFRNLASMDVEESIRGNPIDGVVLLVGCDKTTPSLLMGAASCDLPTIVRLRRADAERQFPQASASARAPSVWQFCEEVQAGNMSEQRVPWRPRARMSRSAGHCMTMGTASTMACMVEALGVGMPHNAAIPAVDSRRYVLAHMAGRRIVEMVQEDLRLSKILTAKPSRTRSASTAPSAARPTPSSTCWRSPGGSASISTSTTGTAWAATCRPSST